jgi:hypothetical protein
MRDCYTPTSVVRHGTLIEDKGPAPPDRGKSRRWRARLGVALSLSAAIAWLPVGHARADSADASQPAHYLLMGSAGVPMRLTLDKTFGQTRFAPAFGQVLLGYALPGGRLRHGFGAGVSWNVSHDGGYVDPLYAGDQFAIMPAYLAYYTLNTDVIALGHAGLPIVVRGGRGAGLELGGALAYRLLAGAALFAELDLDAYTAGSFSLLASLQLGVMIDYEVLP